MATLIKTINICKTFPGVKALSDVCIAFQKGEIHALVGENGAGKTTLMRVICGQPDDCTVYVPWTDADQQAGDGQKEAGGFKML
jgi:ABC-type uncharacterized transport system ATPase subunit